MELIRKKGCIALYQSNDLESSKFLFSSFYQSEKYELIECPNIMRLGDKHVLFVLSYGSSTLCNWQH
ncbi:MAG: hypothetical protein ACLUTU_18105 [Blautia faecis]